MFCFLKFLLYPLFKWFLYPYKLINKENLTQDGNTIIVCNHLAKADVLYMTYIFKGQSVFLSKKEWFDNKFLGWCLKHIVGAIPIDRDTTDVKAIKTIMKKLKDGKRVVIFPEGTRNKESLDLLPIKDGPGYFAHKCNSTILPLTIAKRPKMFRKNVIYVGQPFKVDDMGAKFNSEINTQITERIKDSLVECREQVNIYLESKKK